LLLDDIHGVSYTDENGLAGWMFIVGCSKVNSLVVMTGDLALCLRFTHFPGVEIVACILCMLLHCEL